ncbi:MAG: alkene reductase [Janthinobacterium lividum]
MSNDLFSPLTLGPTTLPNRMVMAPLTRSRAADGDIPSDLAVTYYAQRATAGLIISEASQVSDQGKGYPKTPGIFTDAQVDGWRKVTDAVHAKGGHIFLQLWHVGRISHPSTQVGSLTPVGPSAIKPAGKIYTDTGEQEFVTPRALELSEIPGVVQQYADAAQNAKNAGFDGVEVHGANGYLLDQFLRDGSNQRTDEYGGSIENRARLMLEVTKAVIKVWGADRVGIRLSPYSNFNDMHDSDPIATFTYVAQKLRGLGITYLHVIEPVTTDHPMSMPETQTKPIAPILREAFGGTFMINGGYNKETGSAAIESGYADLVCFGVPFIANPDLVERYKTNAALNTPDQSSFYSGDAGGYTDYPAL